MGARRGLERAVRNTGERLGCSPALRFRADRYSGVSSGDRAAALSFAASSTREPTPSLV